MKKKYRILKTHEIIAIDDEYYSTLSHKWRKSFFVGTPATGARYRRPIPAKSARKAQNKPQGKTPRKSDKKKRGASPKLAGSKLK